MSDLRSVPISGEQVALVERLGEELIRAGRYEDATSLLAIRLGWSVSPPVREPLENDPDFRRWMEEQGMLAEVVELHGHSKRVS